MAARAADHRQLRRLERWHEARRGTLPGMEMFTPTLDWGNELWTSLIWIAKAWAIAAVSRWSSSS